MIDNGGPTLLRAAAKTFERVLVVSGPLDDAELLGRLSTGFNVEGGVDLAYRRQAAIASYFNPDLRTTTYTTSFPLKYGMNPSNRSADVLHKTSHPGEGFKVLNGNPSYIHLLDASLAWSLVTMLHQVFPRLYAAASFKHNSTAGVGLAPSLAEAYKIERGCG